MPNFDFVCDQGHTFEQVVSLAESEKGHYPACPTCQGKTEKIMLQAPGMCMKGCGWTGKSGKGRTV